ncbi:hypothetical protein [Mycoplasma suis]|uniref:hypothetical protein n=1 Tax=Mycoplasma suis TaxID=57372 RepID=UPI0002D43D40|nr:hypothetical protein [Mycoplasma suis]
MLSHTPLSSASKTQQIKFPYSEGRYFLKPDSSLLKSPPADSLSLSEGAVRALVTITSSNPGK